MKDKKIKSVDEMTPNQLMYDTEKSVLEGYVLDTMRTEYPADYSHVLDEDELGPDQGDDDGTGRLDPSLAMTTVPGQSLDVVAPRSDGRLLYIAEGMVVDLTIPGAQKNALMFLEMRDSYTGVPARKADDFLNKWVRVIGCMAIRMRADIEDIDVTTGEVVPAVKEWTEVLFKLGRLDEDSGMHVIIKGVGQAGIKWVKERASLGIVGDWKEARELMFSRVAFESKRKTYDIATGKVSTASTPASYFKIASREVQ